MIQNLLLVIAMSAATWICGWWGVGVAALLAAFFLHRVRGIAWKLALAAAESWAIFLVADALSGPLARVSTTLGAVLKIPGPALIVVTILFPALIAWSAAMLVREVITMREAAL